MEKLVGISYLPRKDGNLETLEKEFLRGAMWENNVLKAEILSDLPLWRSDILNMLFLDTLKNAPEDSWDVSEHVDGKVMAWAECNGKGYDLYIAAEGGINLKNCSLLFTYLFRRDKL